MNNEEYDFYDNLSITERMSRNYLEYLDKTRASPLCIASFLGFTDSVEQLLKIGANVHHTNTAGKTAIFHALAGGNIECAKLLLDNFANINHIDKLGNICLFYQIWENNYKNVTFLLSNKVDLYISNNDGLSSLFFCKTKYMYELLILKDAYINLTDNDGKTFLDHLDEEEVHYLKEFIEKNVAVNIKPAKYSSKKI
jgi:ankyrin repeat protein